MKLVLERIAESIERSPAAPAFIAGGQAISYRQFHALHFALAADLHARGIREGDTVALMLDHSPIHLCAILALARLGAISFAVSPGLSPEAASALLRRHGIAKALASREAQRLPGIETAVIAQLAARGGESGAGLPAIAVRPEAPLRMSLTSGTTGMPKAIVQTHGGLALRMDQSLWNPDRRSRAIAPELHFTAGLMLALTTLAAGGVVVFPKSYEPADFLAAIQLHAVTHIALSPAVLARMASLLPAESPAFPSLTHLRIMGATPSAPALATIARKFTPEIYLPYAMGELGVITMATPGIVAAHPGSSGRVQPWARLEVLDDSGRIVPPGTAGELRVAVEGMPAGYHGPDAQAASKFRDGWFHPGDRGLLTAEGLVYIEGRSDEILNAGGTKAAPAFIEAILEQFPGVREAGVFPVPGKDGETAIAAAIAVQGRIDQPGLAAFCRERLGPLAPARFYLVDALPRGDMDKIRRAELAALVGAVPAR